MGITRRARDDWHKISLRHGALRRPDEDQELKLSADPDGLRLPSRRGNRRDPSIPVVVTVHPSIADAVTELLRQLGDS